MKTFTVLNLRGNIIAVIESETAEEALEKFFQSRSLGGTDQGLAVLGIARDRLTIDGTVIVLPA